MLTNKMVKNVKWGGASNLDVERLSEDSPARAHSSGR